jgi:predicted O-methyltransferase YrrM
LLPCFKLKQIFSTKKESETENEAEEEEEEEEEEGSNTGDEEVVKFLRGLNRVRGSFTREGIIR